MELPFGYQYRGFSDLFHQKNWNSVLINIEKKITKTKALPI